MVAMPAVEHPLTEDDLLKAFLELDTPAGFKAELIEGKIVVSPPPDGSHETAFALLNRQFMRKAAIELDLAGTKGLVTPRGRFIPDGTISPVGHFETADSWASPVGVLLVFEITSTSPDSDRGAKRLGYAAAGIPCYLLVDRTDGHVTLFTDPEDGTAPPTPRSPSASRSTRRRRSRSRWTRRPFGRGPYGRCPCGRAQRPQGHPNALGRAIRR